MPTLFHQSATDLLLLTTTDAKSGTERTTRLGYVRHDDARLLIGSDLGGQKHPDWYDDLLAHPVVRVELGAESTESAESTETFEALAVPAEGHPPVVFLERAEPDGWQAPHEVNTLADKLMEVHTWLRGQLRQVKTEADAHFAARAAHQGQGQGDGLGAPPTPGLGLQIRQRCLAFCQALEFHHTGEDGHLFPGIARYHPELTEVFDRLGTEHRTVARIQSELAALLADISISEPERFRTELEKMSTELNAHLDYEEESLLPLLAEVPWPPTPPATGTEPGSATEDHRVQNDPYAEPEPESDKFADSVNSADSTRSANSAEGDQR